MARGKSTHGSSASADTGTRLALASAVIAIDGDEQRLARERLDVQPRIGLGAAHEAEVQIAAQQRRDLLGRRQFAQLDADAGMTAAIGANHLRQRGEHQRRAEADAQLAGLAGVGLPGGSDGGVDIPEEAAGRLEQHPPGIGQRHPAAVPVEEPRADDALELLDLRAQRRRRQRQASRGLAEVQLFGHGGKVTQVAELEARRVDHEVATIDPCRKR